METQKWGRKKHPREANAAKKDGNRSFPGGSPCFPGTRPRDGASLRPPLAELGGGAPPFAGNTEGCRVGRAWLGRAAAGGRAALGRAGAPRVALKPSKSWKVQSETTTQAN